MLCSAVHGMLCSALCACPRPPASVRGWLLLLKQVDVPCHAMPCHAIHASQHHG